MPTNEKSSKRWKGNGEFCNCSVNIVTASSTLYITIDKDTNNNFQSMSEYLSCIEGHVNNDHVLKKRISNNTKFIYFELHSEKFSEVNLELVNYADTSKFWAGDLEGDQKRIEFFSFIKNSGYAKKWEHTLSKILGKEYTWKYGAENIFYISGEELSLKLNKRYKKRAYPYSFELYMWHE